MKQIELLGEKVNIAFNMATEIAYEELSGQAFNLDTLQERKSRGVMELGMASIIANNPDTTITVERLLYEATPNDVKLLAETVTSEMVSWLKLPAVVAEKEKSEEAAQGAEEGDTPKN